MARGRRDYEKAVVAVESEGYQDLHGRILMNDDFENTPFKWTGTGTGTHFETRQQRAAYNGSMGAELEVASDAPPASRDATILRYVPTDVTERLAFEIFWRANDITIMNSIEILMLLFDGVEFHRTEILYDQPNEIWRYRNDANVVVDLPGSEQTFRNEAWNELMLSADMAADEYIRMKSNNMEINMGGLGCTHLGAPAGGHLRIHIQATNITADQLIISIDDAVLKELER